MGLLRSETMACATLVLPGAPQEAKKYIQAIGLSEAEQLISPSSDIRKKTCHVQFEDANKKSQHRPYKHHIQRLNEMQRILRTFLDPNSGHLAKFLKSSPETCHIEEYLDRVKAEVFSMDLVEKELKVLDTKLSASVEWNDKLLKEKDEAEEELKLVEYAMELLEGKGGSGGGLGAPLLLNTLAGVVVTMEVPRLKRALWRASRGKAFMTEKNFEVEVDATEPGLPKVKVEKTAFVVYFQGAGDGGTGALLTKVHRLCQGFNANIFEWPKSSADSKTRSADLNNQIREKASVLQKYQDTIKLELAELMKPIPAAGASGSGNSKIEDYRLFCLQEHSTYAIMNYFETGMTMRCQIWYPEDEAEALNEVLFGVDAKVQAFFVPEKELPAGVEPPTYVQTNDFLEPWQDVVDTYGIPNYKTVNPAVITSVTFPFIFGMMYGDIGHGTLLFLAGVCMIIKGPSLKYSAPIINYMRYMLTSMGFFAIFAGFMYNDLFGMVSLPLFESRWTSSEDGMVFAEGFNDKNVAEKNSLSDSFASGPYPFGLDPAWGRASNELLFVNNLKMKLSVLIGVLQMMLGVGLRFCNALYNNNNLDLFFECVPMLIFMVCFFGYMDFMIVYKWTHWIGGQDGGLGSFPNANGTMGAGSSNGPPGIINSLICMGMQQEDKQPLYEGAIGTEFILFLLTAISVPWILAPKPIIQKFQNDAKKKAIACQGGEYQVLEGAAVKAEDVEVAEEASGGHGHGHGEFQFGEVMIHQIIETIEYVLGTVSHTASYLRVWALSLAHQQLSLVFYGKTIQMGFAMSASLGPVIGGVICFLMFGAWFGVTVAVLCLMDVLECFLHTLRLHWVEFQSKFYKNEGIKFEPYNILKKIMDPDAK